MAKDKHDSKWLKLIDDAFALDEQEPFLSSMAESKSESGIKGGAGSGNFSHTGRPGLVGGSGLSGGLRRFLDFERPHILAIAPTGQELDVPSVNWNEVSKLYLKTLPVIEVWAEQIDLSDVYHLALEHVFEALSSPSGQAALSMLPNLFKTKSGKTEALLQNLNDAIAAKERDKAVVAATQLLALCYETQLNVPESIDKAASDQSVSAMEQLVTLLGDDPKRVKEIWLRDRKQ